MPSCWELVRLRVPDRSDGAGAMHHAKNRVLYQRNRVLGSRNGAVGRPLVISSFVLFVSCNLRYPPYTVRKATRYGVGRGGVIFYMSATDQAPGPRAFCDDTLAL